MFHQPQSTNSSTDAGNNTAHMVFEGELAVKLLAKAVKVLISLNGNLRQDQVTKGRVFSPEFTNN